MGSRNYSLIWIAVDFFADITMLSNGEATQVVTRMIKIAWFARFVSQPPRYVCIEQDAVRILKVTIISALSMFEYPTPTHLVHIVECNVLALGHQIVMGK
jgi:hypothetical protein